MDSSSSVKYLQRASTQELDGSKLEGLCDSKARKLPPIGQGCLWRDRVGRVLAKEVETGTSQCFRCIIIIQDPLLHKLRLP